MMHKKKSNILDNVKTLDVLDKNDNPVVFIDNTGTDEPILCAGGNEGYYKVKIEYKEDNNERN
jgi:hypothetical protein